MGVQQLGTAPTTANEAATKSYVDTRTPLIFKSTVPPVDQTAVWIDIN